MSIGQTTKGCTEMFHYHHTDFKQNKVVLDKYDDFYREVSYPLNFLQIEEFLTPLEDAFRKKDWCSLQEFRDYFSLQLEWQTQLSHENTPFMNLLHLDNLFLEDQKNEEALDGTPVTANVLSETASHKNDIFNDYYAEDD